MFIIGNRGSFSKSIIEEIENLSAGEEINTFLINKNSNPGQTIDEVYRWLKTKGNFCEPIIFIGGETNREENMHLMNVTLPFYLFLIASTQNVRLIYLSSLSVFGIPNSEMVDLNSRKMPKDIYGKSKLMLDEIISLNIYKNVSTILPGSIVTKARPGILLKVHNLRDISILRFLFKIIPFTGGISISTIEMISKIIYEQTKVPPNSISNKIICSKLVYLDEVSQYLNDLGIKTRKESVKPIFKFNLPISFIRIFTTILPYKLKRKMIFFFKPVFYKNNS